MLNKRIGLITAGIIAVCIGFAFFIRVYSPWHAVFGGATIRSTSIDAYFQMRVIENLVHHFPNISPFDPFGIFPGGSILGVRPFFYWLIGGFAWLIGLGHPAQSVVDTVGAVAPAVLGALVVIPVYFIGKTLFGRWAGILSAVIVAVLPGEFLGRSIMGYTDYHVAEVLFSTTAAMFLIMAIKTARTRGFTLQHLKERDWAVCRRPLVFTGLAGLFLGIYLDTWAGALLFVFIFTAYFIVQAVIDHLRRQSTDYLFLIGSPLFIVALLVFLVAGPSPFYLLVMVIAIFIPAVMWGTSWLLTTRTKFSPVMYLAFLAVIAVVFLGAFYLINPNRLDTIFRQFNLFVPVSGAQLATMEMVPFFSPNGSFTLSLAWGNFTFCFYFTVLAWFILLWVAIKRLPAGLNVLLLWTIVTFFAMIGQRRFAYYFVINVALLSGYFSYLIIRGTGLMADWMSERIGSDQFRNRFAVIAAGEEPAPLSKKAAGIYPLKRVSLLIIIIVVLAITVIPNIQKGTAVAKGLFYPSNAWVESLLWLRDNSPDPLGNAEAYNEYYPLPPQTGFDYPPSAYGVTSWWDYGYWITRIAHRIPTDSPGPYTARADVGSLLLSTDNAQTQQLLDKFGTKYIIIDNDTMTSKYYALFQWSGVDQSKYFDTFYVRQQDSSIQPVKVFYPAYYESLGARLFDFDGKAVTAQGGAIIQYQSYNVSGQTYKVVTDAKSFTGDIASAEKEAASMGGDYVIAGVNPLVSPVSVPALDDFKLVHSSTELDQYSANMSVPDVKIYEYLGNGQ